jgi:tubulin--tyrosine ligase
MAGALSVPIAGPDPDVPSLHIDHIPCIAVSYGVVTRPVSSLVMERAHDIAADVCERLWDDWGFEQGSEGKRPVQVYSVNVPLVEDALAPENIKVVWTRLWRNAYGRLFQKTKL